MEAGRWVQGNIEKFGSLDIRVLGLRGAVGSFHPLNEGVSSKDESMALIQAAATLSVKPYFCLQPMSLSQVPNPSSLPLEHPSRSSLALMFALLSVWCIPPSPAPQGPLNSDLSFKPPSSAASQIEVPQGLGA